MRGVYENQSQRISGRFFRERPTLGKAQCDASKKLEFSAPLCFDRKGDLPRQVDRKAIGALMPVRERGSGSNDDVIGEDIHV